MPATFNWTVTNCDYHDDNGCSQAIRVVHASVEATDGSTTTKARNHTFALGQPDPNAFVAFDSLTQADLLGMIDADEKAQAEADAETALNDLIASASANAGKGLPATFSA